MDNTQENIGNWFVDKLSLYQSANSSNDSIKKNFVIRQAEFEIIISELKNKSDKDPLQHELLLGRRGSGKSTLLRRIQAEIEENPKLQNKYIAINLAEEQAGIYRLFDLWEEVLKEISMKLDVTPQLTSYDQFNDNHDYTRHLYETIHAILTKHKKKVVLLLDNFDRIVGNFTDDGNLLRETLLNHNDIQIIAGSTRMDEHFWQYDKPFYEFFRRHRLEALNITEIIELLNHWAEVMKLPQLAEFASTNIGKIEAIRILTDGLPRTLQFFIQILLQNANLYGYEYLRKVMDNVTTLYQERLNNLPAAQRKIVAEMAFIWEACATKELVEKCRMESKLISANIKQLSNAGIIDTITTDKKNHLYRISERFFNMWLIVTQGNPEQKRKAKWLSIFLESWYDNIELKQLADDHIGNMENKTIGYDKALVFTKAFSQSKYITVVQRDRLLDLTNALKPVGFNSSLLELPKKYSEIVKEIMNLFKDNKLEQANQLVNEIENEADGLKFFFLGLIFQKQENFIESEKYYQLAIEKGTVQSFFNLAILYTAQKRLIEAEKYYLLSIKYNVIEAFFNLSLFYYSYNIKKASALEFIKSYNNSDKKKYSKNLEIQIIIETWNGHFDNLREKVETFLIEKKYENIHVFLTSLMVHEQTNLVFNLFTDNIHGPELQKRYSPLYYAVQILNNKTGNYLELRVPPEIRTTVNYIVTKVIKTQQFFAS